MPETSRARRKKLWSTLALLDALLVIICAGSLGVKVFFHRSAPAPLIPAPHEASIPVQKSSQTAKISEPPGAQTPAAVQPRKPQARASAEKPAIVRHPPPRPETAQPQESAAQAPAQATKAQTAARNRRLVIEWQNAREIAEGKAPAPATDTKARNRRLIIEWQKPQPAAPGQALEPATAAQPGQPRHSIPVDFKLVASRAKNVQLAGAFIVHGGRRQMVQQGKGEWVLTLRLLPGIDYRYWFIVDGKKTLDPKNPKTERKASVISIP
jgi:cytoskeletal protein RodZ